MDDADIGHHCELEGCSQKDYFSFQCDMCKKHFCGEHRNSCGCLTAESQLPKEAKMKSVIRNACSFLTHKVDEKSGDKRPIPCEAEGVAACKGCSFMYCIEHRLEWDHNCASLQKDDTKEKMKANLMDRIKARAAADKEKKEAATDPEKPKSALQLKVEAMKARAKAKK